MDRVPDRVKSFYRVNNVRRFRYDRPFHKGPKDKENEFKVNRSRAALTLRPGASPCAWGLSTLSPRAGGLWQEPPNSRPHLLQSLWIERTTLTLSHSLPGISRWFQVERRELVRHVPGGTGLPMAPRPWLWGPFSGLKQSASAPCLASAATGLFCAGCFVYLLSLDPHSTPGSWYFSLPIYKCRN